MLVLLSVLLLGTDITKKAALIRIFNWGWLIGSEVQSRIDQVALCLLMSLKMSVVE